MVLPDIPESITDFSNLTRTVRNSLKDKIIEVLVPKHVRSQPYNDPRMIEFAAYVDFLENKAFSNSRTRDDYYAVLASIIFKMQKKQKLRPKGSDHDMFSNIPKSEELGRFMELTQAEQKEFDEKQNISLISCESTDKSTLTHQMRLRIVEKLGSMLFPPPDAYAKNDGRMDRINRQLRQIEVESYDEAETRDDYYNIASFKAYSLHKAMKKNGESYVDREVRYPNLPRHSGIANDIIDII